jgi:hypothetical protein
MKSHSGSGGQKARQKANTAGGKFEPEPYADNIPNQYPCFGFFGFCLELASSSQLIDWAITNCTTGLYKIGQGQLPAGLIATCRTPKIAKHMGQ